MLSCSQAVFSQNTLNIYQKTGNVVSYSFNEKPVVTYSGGDIVLTTASVTVNYPLAALDKFTFTDTPTDVVVPGVSTTGDGTTFIYNSSGVLLNTVPDGLRINLAGMEKGIYMIKNNKTTYKITRK